jgi:hypothetical protein
MLSANAMYKQSGSTLSFKDWLEREKSKGKFIPNIQAQMEFENADGAEQTAQQDLKDAGQLQVGSIVGKNLLISLAIVAGGILIYKYYKKNK